MKRRRLAIAGTLAVTAAVCLAAAAQAADEPSAPKGPFENIHVIDFEGDIEGLMHAYVKRRVEAAQEDGADCIVLRVDSFGGTVFHSKLIGDLLVELPQTIHTVAWIPTKAISGAAFISLACREIVMDSSASIGDSQPIVSGADGKPDPVGEKIESPLRTWFRSYAEENGYPAALAEAMVSAHIEVLRLRVKADGQIFYVNGQDFRDAADDTEFLPGVLKTDLQQIGAAVVRKGELLTMTAREAMRFGFVLRRFEDGAPGDEDALLDVLKAPGGKITFTEMSFSEEASKWLLGLAGILSALVALSIMLFIWQGPGIMTVIGGIALILVIFINVTAEQMHGFPLFLMLVGVGLLVAEVFLIPGFGIPGILGIGSLAFGLLLLATGRSLDDVGTLERGTVVEFGMQFVVTAIVGFGTLLLMSRWFPKVGPARRMILQPAGGTAGPTVVTGARTPAVGAVGEARSALRPAGTAEIDGELTDVVSEGAFIDPGTRVRVISVEGERVTVEAVDA